MTLFFSAERWNVVEENNFFKIGTTLFLLLVTTKPTTETINIPRSMEALEGVEEGSAFIKEMEEGSPPPAFLSRDEAEMLRLSCSRSEDKTVRRIDAAAVTLLFSNQELYLPA